MISRFYPIILQIFVGIMISNSGFNQNFLIALFNQQTSQSKFGKIIFIGGVNFVPKYFWNYAKKCSSIAMEITGRNGCEFHFYKIRGTKIEEISCCSNCTFFEKRNPAKNP